MKEIFDEKLVEVYDGAPKRDIKIVLGDFNEKIGREVSYHEIYIYILSHNNIPYLYHF